jgi:hypothetical protein
MSDVQAPGVLVGLTAAWFERLDAPAEQFLGHLFSSFVGCGGLVASVALRADRLLGYLIAREAGVLRQRLKLVARPTELGTVLLRIGHLFGLDDTIDYALAEIDHLSINAYLADDFTQFGRTKMPGGVNATYHIGHDLWTVEELERDWPDAPQPKGPGIALTSILAALLLPDRTPWFILPKREAKKSANSGEQAPTSEQLDSINRG